MDQISHESHNAVFYPAVWLIHWLHTRKKTMNDEEQYVALLRKSKKGRKRERCYSEYQSYQSGSMHVNESIDRGADRCCIYNTGESWINAYLMCKEPGIAGGGVQNEAKTWGGGVAW